MSSESLPILPIIINLQSHAFLQTYGAILPTSLTYIILLARGYSPWRPDAVIGTTSSGFTIILYYLPIIIASYGFHGLLVLSLLDFPENWKVLPDFKPYLRMILIPWSFNQFLYSTFPKIRLRLSRQNLPLTISSTNSLLALKILVTPFRTIYLTFIQSSPVADQTTPDFQSVKRKRDLFLGLRLMSHRSI